MPWTKAIQAIEQKMQRTFDKVSLVIMEQDKFTYEKALDQLNIFKRSQQIKHNRLDARLLELEKCFEGELNHYRKTLEERDRAAAKEIDEGKVT